MHTVLFNLNLYVLLCKTHKESYFKGAKILEINFLYMVNLKLSQHNHCPYTNKTRLNFIKKQNRHRTICRSSADIRLNTRRISYEISLNTHCCCNC